MRISPQSKTEEQAWCYAITGRFAWSGAVARLDKRAAGNGDETAG
jgi:hypothetical protein